MDELIREIEQADEHRITQIIRAVIRRYGRVFPDQEIVFLSLPMGDVEERQQTLRHALEVFGMKDE